MRSNIYIGWALGVILAVVGVVVVVVVLLVVGEQASSWESVFLFAGGLPVAGDPRPFIRGCRMI